MPARRSDRYGRSVALQTRCPSADATGPGLLQVGLITGTIRGPALGGRQNRAAPSASASQPPADLVPASDEERVRRHERARLVLFVRSTRLKRRNPGAGHTRTSW
jgi:hypothetical protein